MRFFDSVISGYLRCLDFNGRSSRSEFWWFFLFSIMLCLLVLNFTAENLESKLSSLNEENFFQVFFNSSIGYAILVTAIPQISLSIRRFHDIGKSGWWYFTLQIVPIFLLFSTPEFWIGIIISALLVVGIVYTRSTNNDYTVE